MASSFPKILAIDTAAAQCGVALLAGDQCYALAEAQQRGQAERLFPMIQEILFGARMAMTDLDAIAVTVGPGSFTGLRVGLAAAHGLALALDVPAIGIDSFAAFAASLPTDAPTLDRVVIIESRRAELFCQQLAADGTALGEPVSLLPIEIAAAVRERPALLCGDGCEAVRVLLAAHPAWPQLSGPDPIAVARLGLARLAEGGPFPAPGARYIRSPDAKPANPA